MKKTIRNAILCLVTLMFVVPILGAQELGKYRNISLGTSLAKVLKQTEQKQADVKTLHQTPALLQEVTWWPPLLPGSAYQADSVRQVLFSFYNGELYKMNVSYERSAVEGMTPEDMVKSISRKYGAPTQTFTDPSSAANGQPEAEKKLIARWEDAQNSFDLVRSSYTEGFGLVIYCKSVDANAEVALSQALKVEEEQGPQKEALRLKQVSDDAEVARQKNLKSFQP
jgi:hypothetical protein